MQLYSDALTEPMGVREMLHNCSVQHLDAFQNADGFGAGQTVILIEFCHTIAIAVGRLHTSLRWPAVAYPFAKLPPSLVFCRRYT